MTGTHKKALMLCVLAFLLRLGAAIFWPGHFWAYTVYYDMASVLARGGGYCMSMDGHMCAYFPPVYPTVLAAGILTGHAHAAIAAISCLIGAGTVWMVWLTGRRLFGPKAGFLAAAYAAVYPYFVWHDAVVQENATLAFVVACAVFLLLRSHGESARALWLGTGAALALTVLTKANLLLFVPPALVWMALFSVGNGGLRARRALWVGLGAAALLGPWMVRTWRITGSPVLYSNGGYALWTSNHRLTFDYFPERSIDEAHNPEWDDTSLADRRAFEAIEDPQEIRQSRWYWDRGMAFIEANPGLTLRRAFYKIRIAFSPRFSPAKSGAFQMVYFASYFPVLALALFGVWRTRGEWREAGYLYLLAVTFALGSAVLWAHTSHRMYVEPGLMVLGAGGVYGMRERRSGDG